MTEGEMSLEIGRFNPTTYVPPVRPVRQPPAHTAAVPARRPDVKTDAIPPVPPENVRGQVDRAAEIAAQLAAVNRELHFSKDETTGRVVIQVRDFDGNVIRTIPPKHALDVMTGSAL
jgi:hypothetical protein